MFFFAEELRDHFGAYGEIESINVKTDPNTGRSRGFAFIVFKAADSIDKVMAAGEHTINNKKVDPKKAKARHGKIFVGGLSSEISDDEIKNFFGNFGTVSEYTSQNSNWCLYSLMMTNPVMVRFQNLDSTEDTSGPLIFIDNCSSPESKIYPLTNIILFVSDH